MIMCVIGIPLSGKTTVAKYLADRYGAYYLSTGDIFRKMNQIGEDVSKTDLSLEYDREIRRLVIAECIIQKHIIVDGYPRSLDQLYELMGLEKDYRIVYVYTPLPIVLDRAKRRKRDWQDAADKVISRARAARKLWTNIREVAPEEKLLYYCDIEHEEHILSKFVEGAFNAKNYR